MLLFPKHTNYGVNAIIMQQRIYIELHFSEILQARVQQYMNCELPNVQEGFKTCRETRDQTANIHWIIEKAREFQKKRHLFLLY